MGDDRSTGTKRDASRVDDDDYLAKKMKKEVLPSAQLRAVWRGWDWFFKQLLVPDSESAEGRRIPEHDREVMVEFMAYHRFSPHSIGDVPQQRLYDLVDRWNNSHLYNRQLSVGIFATVLTAVADWLAPEERCSGTHLRNIAWFMTDLEEATKKANNTLERSIEEIRDLKDSVLQLGADISAAFGNHTRALTQ